MITPETMLRVGIVSDVNENEHCARVYFPDAGDMVSGWLYVLQFPGQAVSGNTSSAGSHSHGGIVPSGGSHSHSVTATVTQWNPSVNDRVLCIMMCGEETDGYILGAIP